METAEEIRAETSTVNRPLQISIRRRKDSHIDPTGSRPAHPLELAVLKHSQELHLQFQRQFSYFVKQYGSAVGQLETAEFCSDGSSESAFFVSK